MSGLLAQHPCTTSTPHQHCVLVLVWRSGEAVLMDWLTLLCALLQAPLVVLLVDNLLEAVVLQQCVGGVLELGNGRRRAQRVAAGTCNM